MRLLEETLQQIEPLNQEVIQRAKNKLDLLSKPIGSLGKLEDLCIQLAGIYETIEFNLEPKVVIGFAGDHGVYEEGVAKDPQWITKAQIPNFAKKVCAVGTLAQFMKADVVAVDVGVKCEEPLEGILDYKIRQGTSNMVKGPAMSREEAIRSVEIGIEVAKKTLEKGYKVLAIGEMGIANTTPTSAIISVFAECEPKEVTGKGSGLSPEGVAHKAEVIRKAIELNKPDKKDAIDVLSKVGGFEIGAMAGAILGAAAMKVPVVLDGFISYAAAIIAKSLCAQSTSYMIASHYSAEPGTVKATQLLEMEPILHLDMRLGEGSGGILVFQLLEAANYLFNHMATREDSGC